jgi:hypothetical protein
LPQPIIFFAQLCHAAVDFLQARPADNEKAKEAHYSTFFFLCDVPTKTDWAFINSVAVFSGLFICLTLCVKRFFPAAHHPFLKSIFWRYIFCALHHVTLRNSIRLHSFVGSML